MKNLRKDLELQSEKLKKIRMLIQKSTHGKQLSEKSLDKIALLAGFQSWKDLNEALHGDADASLNYEDIDESIAKKDS